MKLAIIGSRTLYVENLADYLPRNVTEIVTGGAKGIDSAAADFARNHNIKLTLFLPQYDKYRRAAQSNGTNKLQITQILPSLSGMDPPKGPPTPLNSSENRISLSQSSGLHQKQGNGKIHYPVLLFVFYSPDPSR